MRFQRSYDLTLELKSEVQRMFRRARNEHWTHARLMQERENRIDNHYAWAKMPQWARRQITAYYHGQLDALMELHLVWKVVYYGEYVMEDCVKRGDWHNVMGGAKFYPDAPVMFGREYSNR